MWEPFAPEKVGIPRPSQENGCKMVLTTREWKVCQGMKTEKDIEVGSLPEDEAWAFFEDRAGRDTVLDSNVENVARLVAKECMGLPLALDVVGAALRRVKDAYEWKRALKQLRGSDCQISGLQGEVFVRLKFSYDRLSDEKMRACFLYCSLYPEDYRMNVDEVIRYWMCEGLIDDEGNMDEEMSEGHFIVNELIRSSLLQNDSENQQAVEYVKMHDLLRDMAIGITKKNPHFIVRAGTGLEEPLKNEEWLEDVQRVSLMGNKITNLSVIPNWSKVSTLLLQSNRRLRHLSPSFFQHMCILKVLDLSRSGIETLPESLSELVNLRALLLFLCRSLSGIPSLSKLKELRQLDLSFTAIRQLPLGMENLTNLRFLSLYFTKSLETVSPGLMSKLNRLEILNMAESTILKESRRLVDDIVILSRLAYLELNFYNLATLTHYVESGHSKQLNTFIFHVGLKIHGGVTSLTPPLYYGRVKRRTVFADGSGESTKENSFLLPGNTQRLELFRCRQLDLFSLLSRSGVRGLTSCEIDDCDCAVLFCLEESDASLLYDLEEIKLRSLESLQIVYRGVALHDTFERLKRIDIGDCHKLEYLFRVGELKNLHSLQRIAISDCGGMVEVFPDDEAIITELPRSCEDNTIILPQLERVRLQGMENLRRICSYLLVCNSMYKIQIGDCPKLEGIPFSISNSREPEGMIEEEKAWWEALDWADPATEERLLPLFWEYKKAP